MPVSGRGRRGRPRRKGASQEAETPKAGRELEVKSKTPKSGRESEVKSKTPKSGRESEARSKTPKSGRESEVKSKTPKSTRESESSEESESKKAPTLYCTIKHCVLCDTSLSDHKIPWNDGLQKRFESFCTFLNLELDDRHSWDYKQENFPFCTECTSLLDYFHIMYTRLEKLHTNVALGVRKIRRLVLRTNSSEDTTKVASDKYKNTLKSSKSLEYRVKFVRTQIMTAMNDNDSDDEEIILPPLTHENADEACHLVQAQDSTNEGRPGSKDVVQSTSTPSFEVIPIKVDEEQSESGSNALSAAADITNATVHSSKSKQDAETQYSRSDIALEETELEGEVGGVGVGSSDEMESQDYQSCDDVDDEPIDEFQAFLEEQLQKRKKAAKLAEMIASRPVEKQSKNVEQEAVAPVKQPLKSSDDVQLLAPGTMDFFEEKPEIVELENDGSMISTKRSVRPRRKSKINTPEYVVVSDADDDDFDISKEAMEEGSDNDFETNKANSQDKRLHRQRKKARLSKTDEINPSGTSMGEKGNDNIADENLPSNSAKNAAESSWLVPVKEVNNIVVSEIPTPDVSQTFEN